MKFRLPQLFPLLILLLILVSCSTPGTSGNSGPRRGSAGGMLKAQLKEIAGIPLAILSIPGDILGDPSAMGALSQVASAYAETSSSSYSGSDTSTSAYSSYADSSGEIYTGVNPRMLGDGGGDGSEEQEGADESSSSDNGVKAFEKAQMDKVDAYKRWVNGGSASPGGAGGGAMQNAELEAARHTRQVPAMSDNEWAHVGDFNGVRVWWKHRLELKDQVESALKMENLNSFRVTVSYRPWFIASDGTEYTESGGRFSISPGAIKSGNTGGLFFYVKDARRASADPPRSGGIRDMTVTPSE